MLNCCKTQIGIFKFLSEKLELIIFYIRVYVSEVVSFHKCCIYA